MSNKNDIVFLKRRRAMIQGSCTRIKTFVGSVAPKTVTPFIMAQLEERRVKLDHWLDYESV